MACTEFTCISPNALLNEAFIALDTHIAGLLALSHINPTEAESFRKEQQALIAKRYKEGYYHKEMAKRIDKIKPAETLFDNQSKVVYKSKKGGSANG
jgi:hypothetical protein